MQQFYVKELGLEAGFVNNSIIVRLLEFLLLLIFFSYMSLKKNLSV